MQNDAIIVYLKGSITQYHRIRLAAIELPGIGIIIPSNKSRRSISGCVTACSCGVLGHLPLCIFVDFGKSTQKS